MMKFINMPVALLFLMMANLSDANIITVNTESDIIADDGFCSLREAVEASRIHSTSGDLIGECVAGDVNSVDTLNFQLVFPALIVLESPLPISNALGLNIIGPGYQKLRIHAVQTNGLSLSGDKFLLSGFELSGGWVGGFGVGGALSIVANDTTLRAMKFSDSIAVKGGAIYAELDINDKLIINSCIFDNNRAFGGNSGVSAAGYGGGLYVQLDQDSELTIKNTTFQNNSAEGLNYNFVNVIIDNQVVQSLENVQNGYGGAIFMHGETFSGAVSGTVTLSNSTFSGNYSSWGGAAINAGGSTIGNFDGDLIIKHTTIHNNTIGDRNEDIINIDTIIGKSVEIYTPYNGISYTGAGSTTLFNSIITGTSIAGLETKVLDLSLGMRADQLIKQTFNIIGNTDSPHILTGSPNAQNSYVGNEIVGFVNADLQDLSTVHGGFTAVHMPQGTPSIVIDKGSCPGLLRDQRDYNNVLTGLRIKDTASHTNGPGDACDIGAVELAADFTNNFAPKLIEDYYHLNLNTSLATTDATGTSTYTISSDNGLLANDVDFDGDSLTLTNTGVQVLGNGSLELFADGNFTFSGHDLPQELSFTYDVTDGIDTRTQTAIIDLTPLPAPNAVDDFYTTPFNTVLITTDEFGSVTADVNDDGALANDKAGATSILYTIGLTFGGPYFGIIKVGGIGGTFVDNLDGLFTYTPPVGVSGIATIEYSNYVLGAIGDNHATISIEVLQQSIAAVDDSYSVRYDQILSEPAATGVLANDLNNPTITTAGVFTASPLGGTVELFADGSFNYTPNGNVTGIDSFEYSVDDNGVISNAIVSINVTSPVAFNDYYVIDEDEDLEALDITGTVNGTNDDGVLVNDITTGITHVVTGEVILESDTLNQKIVFIDPEGGVIYQPHPGESGVGIATYTVLDDNGMHNANIEITVNSINDDPSFISGGDVNIAATSSVVTINHWAYAISAGRFETGQVLNFVLTPTSSTGGLSFIAAPQISPTGKLSFQTQPGSTGTIDIDVVLFDDEGAFSPTDSFRISVDAVNNPPQANSLVYEVIEDEILHVSGVPFVSILSNDTDADGHSLQVENTGFQPVDGIGGDLYLYANGYFYYRSPSNVYGVATFQYTITDGALTDTATISINVAEQNDKPQLQDDPQGTFLEDEILPIIDVITEMFANDSAGENEITQTLSLLAISQETGGTVNVIQDDLQFTLEQDFNGVAFFQYQAIDNGTTNGVNDTKTGKAFVGYSITPVNDAPTFNKGMDYNTVPSASNIVVSLPNWVTQVSAGAANESSQTVTFAATTTVQSGDLTFVTLPTIDNNTLSMSFTVMANTSGIAEVEISAIDSGGTSNGGVNTSTTQVMRIEIAEIAEEIFANSFED